MMTLRARRFALILAAAIVAPAPAAADELPGVALATGAAIAAPGDASDRFRFVVLADSRGTRNQPLNVSGLDAVMAEIATLDPQPLFIFFTGDLTWGFKSEAALHADLRAWRSVIDRHYPSQRVLPVFGGHERKAPSATAREAWSAFRSFFDPVAQGNRIPEMECKYMQPGNNPPRDRSDFGHSVYYCDYGEARFFVLNNDCIPPRHSVTGDLGDAAGCVAHELGCAQRNWVRRNLVDNGKRYNFFLHHEPAFGTGAHDAGEYDDPGCPATLSAVMDRKVAARNNYLRLLGYNRGSAIFSGHEHQFTWRHIDHELLRSSVPANRWVSNSLAILIKAERHAPGGGATAFSLEGARDAGAPGKAPLLRLWWTSRSGPPDATVPIRAEIDDVEEFRGRGGEVYLGSSDLELMRDPDLGPQKFVGLRFRNLPIPRGQRLLKANILFTAKKSSAAGPRVRIVAERAAFALPFNHCQRDLSRRKKTAWGKTWRIGPWQQGSRYSTPDIAPLIRNLIQRHHFGGPIGMVAEIKTGSSGAPWYDTCCRRFMGGLEHERVDLSDYTGAGTPFHFAVIDVMGAGASGYVSAWDGTILAPLTPIAPQVPLMAQVPLH